MSIDRSRSKAREAQERKVAQLTEWGHVDIVTDGAAAVEAFGRKAYDLILMDIHMPSMDRIEATMRIRGLECGSARVPIIAMTSNVMAEEIERFEKAGMDGHLGRPFLPRQLKAIIDQWSETQPLRQSDGRRDKHSGAATSCQTDGSASTIEVEMPALDGQIVAEIEEVLGKEKVAKLAAKFEIDIRDRFAALTDQVRLRLDAHNTSSSAGALGFVRLSEAARTLEAACVRDADLADPIRACLNARDEAIAIIASRFLLVGPHRVVRCFC